MFTFDESSVCLSEVCCPIVLPPSWNFKQTFISNELEYCYKICNSVANLKTDKLKIIQSKILQLLFYPRNFMCYTLVVLVT